MRGLDQKLIQYQQSNFYPFHMPGHKRKNLPFPNPFGIDITEIDGFDNLHHASGIIKDAQCEAAALYGSARCFYLINGSTCGLLASICASVQKRDKVIVARNCHKAVYHALFLNELHAEYIYPVITPNDLQGAVTPEQVKLALLENPDAAAVIITSPTYEGIISDIEGIAQTAHSFDVPLIVDEAHGAHLGFGGDFPENAVRLGADAVVMSLHKTLPSFTQTALLHLNTERIDADAVERYLGIFETSSPSYLFMAGIDACIRMLKEQGKEQFSEYRKRLNDFYRHTADLENLHVMTAEDLPEEAAYCWDDSKLVIFSGKTGLTGEALSQILRKSYHLEMEMASGGYVLGMTSLMDEREGFDRLDMALHKIDNKIKNRAEEGHSDQSEAPVHLDFIRRMYQQNKREMQIYQAEGLPYKEVSFSDAAGSMSAESIYLYPPGIPLIVPGEIISTKFIERIRECRNLGLRIDGLPDAGSERIKIVYF